LVNVYLCDRIRNLAACNGALSLNAVATVVAPFNLRQLTLDVTSLGASTTGQLDIKTDRQCSTGLDVAQVRTNLNCTATRVLPRVAGHDARGTAGRTNGALVHRNRDGIGTTAASSLIIPPPVGGIAVVTAGTRVARGQRGGLAATIGAVATITVVPAARSLLVVVAGRPSDGNLAVGRVLEGCTGNDRVLRARVFHGRICSVELDFRQKGQITV